MDKLILFAIFISPFNNLFIFKTGFLDLRIIQVIWTIVFIILLIKKAVNKEVYIRKSIINKGNRLIFFLYIAILVISCLYSINISVSLKELIQYIYLFLIFYVIYIKSKDKEFLHRIVITLVISNALLVLICILSYFSGKAIIPSYELLSNGSLVTNTNLYAVNTLMQTGDTITRLHGVLGLGPTAIANLVLIQSMFVNYLIKVNVGYKRILLFILLVCNFTTIILTYSRVGILLFLIMHIVTILSRDHIKNFFIIIISVCASVVFISVFPNVFIRILETFNLQEQSSKYHFVFWLMALNTGWDNILNGIGLGNMLYASDNYSYLFQQFNINKSSIVATHNFILQTWSEQGAIGLSVTIMLVLKPIINYFKTYKLSNKNNLSYFIIIACVSSIIYNLTNNNFYNESFWIIFGLAYSTEVESSEHSYVLNQPKEFYV